MSAAGALAVHYFVRSAFELFFLFLSSPFFVLLLTLDFFSLDRQLLSLLYSLVSLFGLLVNSSYSSCAPGHHCHSRLLLDIEISMYIIGVARFIIKGIYITPWREEFQTLGISDGLL